MDEFGKTRSGKVPPQKVLQTPFVSNYKQASGEDKDDPKRKALLKQLRKPGGMIPDKVGEIEEARKYEGEKKEPESEGFFETVSKTVSETVQRSAANVLRLVSGEELGSVEDEGSVDDVNSNDDSSSAYSQVSGLGGKKVNVRRTSLRTPISMSDKHSHSAGQTRTAGASNQRGTVSRRSYLSFDYFARAFGGDADMSQTEANTRKRLTEEVTGREVRGRKTSLQRPPKVREEAAKQGQQKSVAAGKSFAAPVGNPLGRADGGNKSSRRSRTANQGNSSNGSQLQVRTRSTPRPIKVPSPFQPVIEIISNPDAFSRHVERIHRDRTVPFKLNRMISPPREYYQNNQSNKSDEKRERKEAKRAQRQAEAEMMREEALEAARSERSALRGPVKRDLDPMGIPLQIRTAMISLKKTQKITLEYESPTMKESMNRAKRKWHKREPLLKPWNEFKQQTPFENKLGVNQYAYSIHPDVCKTRLVEEESIRIAKVEQKRNMDRKNQTVLDRQIADMKCADLGEAIYERAQIKNWTTLPIDHRMPVLGVVKAGLQRINETGQKLECCGELRAAKSGSHLGHSESLLFKNAFPKETQGSPIDAEQKQNQAESFCTWQLWCAGSDTGTYATGQPAESAGSEAAFGRSLNGLRAFRTEGGLRRRAAARDSKSHAFAPVDGRWR